MGVTELAPLTFRALTLPFAAIGMLLVARLRGDSIRDPARAVGRKVVVLALFNIAGWNGLVLFGVQQLPAGRSAILAYTMPIWATLIALCVLHEPLSRRKIVGLVLGMLGHGACCSARRSAPSARAPLGALMILAAAIVVGARHRAAAQMEAADAAEHAVGLDDAARLDAARAARAAVRSAAAVAELANLSRARLVRDRSTTSSSPARSRTGRGSRSRGRCPSPCRRCRRCRCRSSACSPASCCWASARGRRNGSRSRWSSRALFAVLFQPAAKRVRAAPHGAATKALSSRHAGR